MDQFTIFLIIVGMMAVTYGPRLLPITALSTKTLSPWLVKWLQLVPAAVLAAMLVPSLVLTDKRLNLEADNVYLWAALPTFAVAKWTDSFVGAIVAGMGVVALFRCMA
ncbi:AzlD domain-containing protein [Desulfovermiculus halophilus]|jgi:branched-subunit amino acid transport protein|uniref:AzlD domain-containing protein n=1 Tax=Desulfovermiculus halophilus TaxID=339722 RepID=UPI00047F657F|nr:AzlD domain-containing protein [Desulfovermiculus halophilus]